MRIWMLGVLMCGLLWARGQDLLHDILPGADLYQKHIFQYYLDNDAFAGIRIGEDRNYTMGTGFSYGSPNWKNSLLFFPNKLLLPKHIGDTSNWAILTPTLSFGAMGFTPEDIANPDPVIPERPYASLLWLGTTYRLHNLRNDHVHNLSLHYGMLGLDIARDVQILFHTIYPRRPIPEGWHNQISQGGEPTLLVRYQRDKSQTYTSPKGWYWQGNESLRAEMGYRVQLSGAWTQRIGYRGFSRMDVYGFSRIKPQLTLYDALLMGQFQPSIHRIGWNDLYPMVAEFAAGLGASLKLGHQALDIWYGYYGRTPEARYGPETRFHYWGRFQVIWRY